MAERQVRGLITPEATSDGAGVKLRRSIGGRAIDNLDPFLLLDEFYSDDSADYIAGFPDHPHRGFETVTYMLAGRMRHQDSTGNGGSLVPGGVQWMTAGRGIVHSEMPEQEDGLMRGFQLWVNLPASQKMCAPRYQNLEPDEIPEVALDDGSRVRLVAGEFNGQTGAVSGIAVEPLYLDINLAEGARLTVPVPVGHNAFCYTVDGISAIGGDGQTVEAGRLAVLGDGDHVSLAPVGGPARVLLVAGKPINEPIVRYGPFVMNSRDEIIQAVQDFQAGRF